MLAQRHSSGTPDSKNGLAYWQRLMVLSGRTCQVHLLRIPFSSGKFSLTETCHALRWCLSHLRWCLTSIHSVGFVMALAQACTALRSVLSTKKVYIVHQIRKLLNQIEARNTNYSSMETVIVLSPPRKHSDTRTPSDDQWHQSQLQQDR